MDIDRFLATNRPAWDRLAQLTGRAGRAGRLSAGEIDELVELYQRVSTHLSYARTQYRDPALTAQLTGLVARAGAVIYGTRARTLRAVGHFFSVTFPAALWHLRRHVAVSAALFLLPAAVIAVWVANSTAAVEATGPAAVRESYVNEDFEDYYSSQPAAQFASRVFTNNVQVGIMAFATGVLGCIVTAGILALNGAHLGVAAGLFAAVGQQQKFWGLILPHGLLELTAVFVAGGTGLALGWTVIDPGDRPRVAALAEEGRRAVVVVVGLVVVFLVAGLIEGFVTGSRLPTAVRVGIGVVAELAFVAYVLAQGRAAAAVGLTGSADEDGAATGYRRPVALTLR